MTEFSTYFNDTEDFFSKNFLRKFGEIYIFEIFFSPEAAMAPYGTSC